VNPEGALRKQARLIDLAPAAAIVREVGGKVLFWSQGAERLYGWTSKEAIGRRTHELLRTKFPQPLESIVETLRQGGNWTGELVHTAKNGRRVIVESHWLAQLNSSGEVEELLESNVDITERKRTEDLLRESEARFRALAENIPQLAWMANADGWIFWYNRRWFEYTGTNLEEMQGWGWQAVHHPDHVERVTQQFKQALADGQPWEDTFPLRGKDGNYRWFLSRAFPIQDGNGRTTRWFGTNTDITDLRETHQALERAQADLRDHAGRLEEIVARRTSQLSEANTELEAFCYSLSHDMRGPLRAIQSFTQFVVEDCEAELSATAKDYLARVTGAAKRLDRLIQDVLALSRVSRGPAELSPVAIERLARDIIQERPELQEPAAEVVIEGPLPEVIGHEALLTQIITNLLSNAVKFVKKGDKPRVRMRAEVIGEKVRLWVEDHGIGVEKQAQESIFAVFGRQQRTSEYEGTGIGLSIARKAAQRMGGRIGVESEPGKGSRFWVQLDRPK
jgi:PAS domain S-box-containing protein